MADSINIGHFMGNLTRDPETRLTTGGTTNCKLGMALNRRYTNARQEVVEEVCYLDVEAWGKQAEFCRDYLRKGSRVFIEAHLRTDSWEDRETGKPRQKLVVVADKIWGLDRVERGEQSQRESREPSEPRQPQAPAHPPAQSQGQSRRRAAPPAPQPDHTAPEDENIIPF